jgi:hypothetical protein
MIHLQSVGYIPFKTAKKRDPEQQSQGGKQKGKRPLHSMTQLLIGFA